MLARYSSVRMLRSVDGERDHPDWVLAIAGALGAVIALPLAYWMVTDWYSTVSDAGWFAWVMIGWAVLCVGFLLYHVLAPVVERWYYIRLGDRVIRDLRRDTSEPGS